MIAISYRRDDSLAIAGRLYDRLQTKFGKERVFMDFDSIRPGLDFRSQIRDTIERADVVIALVGPKWSGEEAESKRRIDDPNDFVRLEISHALQRDIPIIPVLVNNGALPKPETLPEDIRALVFRHALPLDSGLDFHQHADRVIGSVEGLIRSTPAGTDKHKANAVTTDLGPARPGGGKAILWMTIALVLTAAASGWWFGLFRTQRNVEPARSTVRDVLSSPTPSAGVPGPDAIPVRPQPSEAFVPSARLYAGSIQAETGGDSSAGRSIAISFADDPKSGTMTQSTKYGDFVVRFEGMWEGTQLRAVTTDVVAKPSVVDWTPESFTLQFSENGQRATYRSAASGKSYRAEIIPLPEPLTRLASIYKGVVSPGNTPLRIYLAADRRSGTLTETSKSGDTFVTFTGLWDGDTLHAVTGEVVSKPEKVRWRPESFTLRPAPNGRSLAYTCNDNGRILTANLSAL